jgi:predicted nucleic acid-binding Zn ribbon protein
MSTCASCGSALSSELEECAQCNSEPPRDLFLNPQQQRQNIKLLKFAVLAVILGGVIVVTFARRFEEFRAGVGPAALYVIGGLAIAMLLLRLFIRSTTERL